MLLLFSAFVHRLISNTRWLSVLREPSASARQPPHAAFIGPGNARLSKGFLLIMLWDTWVMKTHSCTDVAPNLMFWCLNSPTLHFLWSHEQWIKCAVIRKFRYRCTLTEVKVHLSRFKNKLCAMSILIYSPQILVFFCGSGKTSVKPMVFKTSQGCC